MLTSKVMIAVLSVSLWALCGVSIAEEFLVGEAIERDGMSVAAAYLQDIDLAPELPTPEAPEVIHLEADIAATDNNPHGFEAGAWIPYLTISYTLVKEDSNWSSTGTFAPMTAQDGPHYAANVPLDGPGAYRVTYHIEPPSRAGFFRHTDDATGVPAWWAPFDVSWTFNYPSNPVAE